MYSFGIKIAHVVRKKTDHMKHFENISEILGRELTVRDEFFTEVSGYLHERGIRKTVAEGVAKTLLAKMWEHPDQVTDVPHFLRNAHHVVKCIETCLKQNAEMEFFEADWKTVRVRDLVNAAATKVSSDYLTRLTIQDLSEAHLPVSERWHDESLTATLAILPTVHAFEHVVRGLALHGMSHLDAWDLALDLDLAVPKARRLMHDRHASGTNELILPCVTHLVEMIQAKREDLSRKTVELKVWAATLPSLAALADSGKTEIVSASVPDAILSGGRLFDTTVA